MALTEHSRRDRLEDRLEDQPARWNPPGPMEDEEAEPSPERVGRVICVAFNDAENAFDNGKERAITSSEARRIYKKAEGDSMVAVQNTGTTGLRIGSSNVTGSKGFHLPPAALLTIDEPTVPAALWAVIADEHVDQLKEERKP